MSAVFSHNIFLRQARTVLASLLMLGLISASMPAPLVFADEVLGGGAQQQQVAEDTTPYESPIPGDIGEEGSTGEEGGQSGEATLGTGGHEGSLGQTADDSEETLSGDDGENGAPAEEETNLEGEAGDTGTSTDATEGGQEEVPTAFGTTSDSTIATGDSTTDGAVTTIANTNTTNTNITTGSSTATSTASSTDAYPVGTTTVTVIGDNTGTSTNDLGFDSQTGQNEAEASGAATIDTGDSRVRISFDNIVNTNIVNSEGLMLFLDQIGAENRGFDLRNTFDDIFRTNALDGIATAESTCSLISCNSTLEELFSNDNDATILNDLIVRSGTGENLAQAGDACASISTGNSATAVAGFNMANTNIIDSNYLLVSMNNFGDMNNDIVFPGMEFFLNKMGRGIAPGSSTTVANTNDADIANNLAVEGNSGDNLASGASTTIQTGDVDIDLRVRNDINQNIFGGDNFYVLVRVFGDWAGDVYGLPEGLMWQQTAEGIEIMSDPAYANAGRSGATAVAGNAVASVLSILNNNTANIENNIGIYALTGENAAHSENGCANIATGDIDIDLALTNMANTNVVGANWVKAFFNIFGDLNGNIAFGRPDLWIGGRADAIGSGFKPDGGVRYTFTVTNFGDSPATDIILSPEFDQTKLTFVDANQNGTTSDELVFPIGTLLPGESVEVAYDARIGGGGALLNPQTPIDLVAEVRSRETDNNYDDNVERLTIVATKSIERSSSPHPWSGMGDSDIEITKSLRSAETIQASSSATFEVVIKNEGGPSKDSVLHDILYNEAGEVIHHQMWELNTIAPDEEIFISYDVFFKGTTPAGVYENHVYVEGTNLPGTFLQGNDDWSYTSDVATAEVTIVAPETEEEIVEAVDEQEGAYCEQYLLKPIQWGAQNSLAEVAKLQTFLNKYEGTELVVNGVYDQATYDALKTFQMKYAVDVLYPWSIYQPTGYVYHTTMKKVNEIYCDGKRTFPLTPDQVLEIERFKMRPEEFGEVGGSAENLLIGMGPVPGGDDDHLAEAEDTVEADRRSQTASVGDAAESAREASESLLERIRSRMETLMNWVSLKYRDARFSFVTKKD